MKLCPSGHMELYQIRHFVAVVETGSFTKAADREAISQPAISASVAKLEAELEVKLLDRRRTMVVPTAAGLHLHDVGKKILALSHSVKTELKALATPKLLRIGILQSLSSRRVSKLFGSFRSANPDVEIEVLDGTSERLTDFLAEGRLDTVLTILDGNVARFASRVLFEEPYSLAVPVEHRLARKDVVEIEDLQNEAFIVRTGADRFEDGANALVARGIKIQVVYQTDQFDRALELVAAGVGLALVPARFEIASVKLVPVADLTIVRRYGLLWSSERETSRLDELIGFAEKHGWAP
jgi:DNA-binding transcriptional LysR family regulator